MARRTPLIPLLVLMVAAGAASTARADDTAGKAFLAKAIQGNMAEIANGKLAAEKGSSDAVKQYGQMLVADHTKANQDAIGAAKSLGLAVPTDVTADQHAMYDKLAVEKGLTFDHDFANGMLQDHRKDVAEYEEAAKDTSGVAGRYAAQTLPTLQQHASKAEALIRDLH